MPIAKAGGTAPPPDPNDADQAADAPGPGHQVYVHLGYGLDAVAFARRFLKGGEHDESPYGFARARALGCSVSFSRDHPETKLARFIRRALRRVLGFDVIHLWRNRASLAVADVVWTMQESEWLAARLLGRVHRASRKPIVGNSVWLFNIWETLGRPRQALFRWLARGPGVLTVHSEACVPLLRQAFAGVDTRLMFFGTPAPDGPAAPRIRARRDGEPIRVLAAGNDRTRDWNTFLAALGNDPRFEVELVCSWLTASERRRHPSLRERDPVAPFRRDEFYALYDWADVVVIPMHENRFSGITVALEAVARGTPVVSTRTGGVSTYFTEDQATYAAPGDARALLDAVLTDPAVLLERATAARARFQRDDYSIDGLIRRYVAYSAGAIAGVTQATVAGAVQ